MEAISTLIIEFVIQSVLRSVVEDSTDTVIRQFSRAVRERLKQGGKPVNHDLQRAVRKAYLQATIVLIDSYLCELGIVPSWMQRDIRYLFRQPEEPRQLLKARRAILHELNQIPKSSYIPPVSKAEQSIELLLQPRGETAQARLDEFKKQLKDQLLGELRHRWEVQPSERLIAMLQNGWEQDQKGTPVVLDWFELVCAFFAEELKQNERVARIFQSQLLAHLSVDGLSVDYHAFTHQLEQLAGQAMTQLQQVEQTLEQLRQEQAEGFHIVQERLDEYLPLLLTRTEAIQTLLQTLQPELRRRPLYEKYAGLELAQRTERVIRMHTALFVGREWELERLDALFNQPSGTLIITAPAGYGKTTLLANWIDQRHKNGCFVAHHFFRKEYDDANRLDSVANALFNLLRQLYIYYAIDSELPPRDEMLLRDTLVGLLQERGALPEEPLVLLLDGLDEAEQELLLTLPSPLPEGVYAVVSIRAEETETPTALRVWMPAPRMSLRTLSRVAISDYLARAGDGELAAYAHDASFVEQVHHKTEGYPLHLRFLVDELLQLAKSGGDVRAALAHTPQGFYEYVRAQLRHLARSLENAEKVQNLFALLATALGALGEREIETLTGLNAFELAALPREATRWFSITERDGERYYAFTHPMLGDAFERALGTLAHKARQQLLNYCARWQEHRSSYALRHYPAHLREANWNDDLYRLARDEMFLQAQRETLPSEPDLPLRTLQIALDAAIAQENAPVIAEMLLRHARRTLSDETPLHALRQGNLERAIGLAKLLLERDYEIGTHWMLLLAWNRHHANDADSAERLLKEILRWWGRQTLEKLSDWQAETAILLLTPLSTLPSASEVAMQTLGSEALKSLALRWVQLGAYDQALAIAQQIKDAKSRSEVLVAIAKALAQIGAYDQALAIAQQIEDARYRSEALGEIAPAVAQTGAYDQALAIAQQIEDARYRSEALVAIAQAMTERGNTEEAQAVLQQAVEAVQQIEDARYRSEALGKIAKAMTERGETEEAQVILQQAVEAVQQIEDARYRSEALVAIAKAMTERGETEEAQVILQQAVEAAQQITSAKSRSEASVKSAKATAHAKVSDRTVSILLQASNARYRSEALVAIASAVAQTGAYEQALAIAQQIEDARYRSEALGKIAPAVAQTGAYDQALAIAQQIEDARYRSEALRKIAGAMTERGNTEEAQAVLHQAVEAVQQIEYAKPRSEALIKIVNTAAETNMRESTRSALCKAWEAARATSTFSALWEIVKKAVELGFDDLAVEYARQIAGERARELPELLNTLTQRGAKEAVLQMVPLCAWNMSTALYACANLVTLYPDQAAEIAVQVQAQLSA